MNIKSAFPSQWLAAAELEGEEKTLKIKDVVLEDVGSDQKPVVTFYGAKKGLVLNKTKSVVIADILGSEETDDWAGHYITIFPDRIAFQGKMVDTISIRSGDAAKKLAAQAVKAEAEKKKGKAAPAETKVEEEDDDSQIPF